MGEADSEVQHESEEVKFKREQEEWKIARTNELKGMYVDDLKTIVTNNGLQVSAKKDMVDAVIKLEKKERVANTINFFGQTCFVGVALIDSDSQFFQLFECFVVTYVKVQVRIPHWAHINCFRQYSNFLQTFCRQC